MVPSKKAISAAAAAAFLCAGCVPVPADMLQDQAPATTITGGVFPGLDPGAKDVSGLHFHVYSYGSDRPGQISEMVEAQYNRVMNDTGLYSFQPHGLYTIVVYGTQDEYRKKTRQPDWSGGVSVGNSIYSYESPRLPMTLAHEMTHLVFHEYMGGPRVELRWLNEGLAVYEETQAAAPPGAGSVRPGGALESVIPFDQMYNLTPATERERNVSLWYRQVGNLTGYIIDRGGRLGFSQFLSAMRESKSLDDALRSAFPGAWSGAADLEAAWRRSLQ